MLVNLIIIYILINLMIPKKPKPMINVLPDLNYGNIKMKMYTVVLNPVLLPDVNLLN